MGIETEFGVTCTFHGHRRLSPDEVARYLFRRVVSWGRSSNVFLRNGARLYLDVGSHPEYATAECDSLLQLVNHDRAGERVLEDLLVDASSAGRRRASVGTSTCSEQHRFCGQLVRCHENFLVVRAGEFSRISDVLLPFLVTRQLICGRRQDPADAEGGDVGLSQRIAHLGGCLVGDHRSRALSTTATNRTRMRRSTDVCTWIVGDRTWPRHHDAQGRYRGVVLEMTKPGFRSADFALDNPSGRSVR